MCAPLKFHACSMSAFVSEFPSVFKRLSAFGFPPRSPVCFTASSEYLSALIPLPFAFHAGFRFTLRRRPSLFHFIPFHSEWKLSLTPLLPKLLFYFLLSIGQPLCWHVVGVCYLSPVTASQYGTCNPTCCHRMNFGNVRGILVQIVHVSFPSLSSILMGFF